MEFTYVCSWLLWQWYELWPSDVFRYLLIVVRFNYYVYNLVNARSTKTANIPIRSLSIPGTLFHFNLARAYSWTFDIFVYCRLLSLVWEESSNTFVLSLNQLFFLCQSYVMNYSTCWWEWLFSSSLIFMNICFNCDTNSFSICKCFVGQFLYSLPLFVP